MASALDKKDERPDNRVRITADGRGVISFDYNGSSASQYHIYIPNDFYSTTGKLKFVFQTDKGPITLEANEVIKRCTQLIQD